MSVFEAFGYVWWSFLIGSPSGREKSAEMLKYV